MKMDKILQLSEPFLAFSEGFHSINDVIWNQAWNSNNNYGMAHTKLQK